MQLIRDNLTLWTSELEEGDNWDWLIHGHLIYKVAFFEFNRIKSI
jgi:hypothetical protein